MKVLITDFWPKEAHKYLNLMMIKALGKYSQATVISINGYYNGDIEKFKNNGISTIEINVKEKKGRLRTRLYCIELQNITKKILRNNAYNLMICLSYETLALAFCGNILKKIPVVLCQHSNLDDLQNPIKRLLIKGIISKTYHIVFEDLFKEWLIRRLDILPNQIFSIAHPITMECLDDEITNDFLYDCVGLCHANDDVLIQSIVDNYVKFEKNNIRIVLRSKSVKSSCDEIEIIDEFLSREKYRNYILNAKCVFVATPQKYQYRLSGSVYDAFALNKTVFTTNKILTKIYNDKYPGICNYISDENELLDYLLKIKNKSGNSESFEVFRKNHSETKLDSQIYNMIKTLSGDKGENI